MSRKIQENDFRNISDQFSGFLERIEKISDQQDNELIGLVENLCKSVKSLADYAQNYLDKLPENYKKLAEYGWYVSDNIDVRDHYKIMEYTNQFDIDKIDKVMTQIVEDEIDEIKELFKKRFPERVGPVFEAIDAHINKKYYISIPVFLAQSDGICDKVLGVGFFKNDRKKGQNNPATLKEIEKLNSDYITQLELEPLKLKGALRKHFSEENYIDITRHSIMHGEVSDYGTYVNSCKTLMLLYYIITVVFNAKKESTSN